MPRESEDILGSACQWIQRDLHFAGVLFILRLLEPAARIALGASSPSDTHHPRAIRAAGSRSLIYT